MALGPNDECYVHIDDIVYLNMPILGKNVCLGTMNNVAEKSFHFRYTKKSFLIFRVLKMGCFVKQLPKICYKFEPQQFIKILDHM